LKIFKNLNTINLKLNINLYINNIDKIEEFMNKNIKKIKGLYYVKIRSRHPSHNVLRKHPELQFEVPAVVRFGSLTEMPNNYIEINSVEAIKNSSSKLRMKKCFDELEVNTTKWYTLKIYENTIHLLKEKENISCEINHEKIKYPLVLKHIYGSRNKGNSIYKSSEELLIKLTELKNANKLNNYIIEEYFSGAREYRLHVSKWGCFYTCRKMIKNDTPEDQRWFRNDSNSTWILEENQLFDKPVNWQNIVKECIKSLKAVGLDLGAVDLRIQSARTSKGTLRENPEFKIIEINSAPSFGEITPIKYKEQIISLIKEKV